MAYIIEVETPRGVRFVESLTATTVSLTENWRQAKRFPNHALPKPAEIEGEDRKVIGYAAV